jgi:transposase InsO family protein
MRDRTRRVPMSSLPVHRRSLSGKRDRLLAFNHDEARFDLNRYIFGFCNAVRLHSTLGYLSPAAYGYNRQ